jgi:hypothetical protein
MNTKRSGINQGKLSARKPEANNSLLTITKWRINKCKLWGLMNEKYI